MFPTRNVKLIGIWNVWHPGRTVWAVRRVKFEKKNKNNGNSHSFLVKASSTKWSDRDFFIYDFILNSLKMTDFNILPHGKRRV